MLTHLTRHFEKLGAALHLAPEGRPRGPEGRPRGPMGLRGDAFVIDIAPGPDGREAFRLQAGEAVETHVLDLQPRDRHLLLCARNVESGALIGKYLCGHDERHWFVAAVPRAATDVRSAKEALKPAAVKIAEKGLRTKLRQRRRNTARLRQGEWFFVPAPELVPGAQPVLRHEPLRRGAGKPHVAEELVRFGGERIYVCSRRPNGVSERAYRRLLESQPGARSWGWVERVRNPRVFVRGAIRHPDHRTLQLPTWHRVLLSMEELSPTVAFVD